MALKAKETEVVEAKQKQQKPNDRVEEIIIAVEA